MFINMKSFDHGMSLFYQMITHDKFELEYQIWTKHVSWDTLSWYWKWRLLTLTLKVILAILSYNSWKFVFLCGNL